MHTDTHTHTHTHTPTPRECKHTLVLCVCAEGVHLSAPEPWCVCSTRPGVRSHLSRMTVLPHEIRLKFYHISIISDGTCEAGEYTWRGRGKSSRRSYRNVRKTQFEDGAMCSFRPLGFNLFIIPNDSRSFFIRELSGTSSKKNLSPCRVFSVV